MKIELKNFKTFPRMSEETLAFVADVYINGVKAAFAKNDGHGGPTYYANVGQILNAKLVSQAEEWAKAQPDHKYESSHGMKEFSVKMDLEHYIDLLVASQEEKQMLAKRQVAGLVVGVPGSEQLSIFKIRQTRGLPKRTIANLSIENLKSLVANVTKQLKPGERILNTNLPTEITNGMSKAS